MEYMIEWLFPFCSREHKTNEQLYHVRFSKVVMIRIFETDEPGYLFDMEILSNRKTVDQNLDSL